MKHHIFSRALSLTAAAVLTWSAGGTGVLRAAAQQQQPIQPSVPPARYTDSSEPVTVIVRVSGDAVMAQPEALDAGSDYLETDAAEQVAAQNKAVQRAVQDSIRQIYPELQVGYSYSTLYNGFSCQLPEDLIERVRALTDVVSVTVSEDIAIPQMNRASALSGFPVFFEQTGCCGEGQVIAVIDSELDTSHPMFAPLADDIETALSREEVTEIINSGALSINADPERAYISSKLPFVIDYVDDPYEGVPDLQNYHGTHVSGIAAGNTYTTTDGTVISGIAKDAQLMFFGVGTDGGYIDGDAVLAAVEDAVKLHADVINMSFGGVHETWDGNPLSDVIFAADRAGVIVCNSAGNADNGEYSWNEPPVPDNPDTCMMNYTPELGSPVLMVASAENFGSKEYGTITFEGQQILCIPTLTYDGYIKYLSDALEWGEYEYVDCGDGLLSEYPEEGLDGRIALVRRSGTLFSHITDNAKMRGAAAVILIDKEEPDGLEYVYDQGDIVINCISFEEGQRLVEAENKMITVNGQKMTVENTNREVSTYTSWGVKQSLDLRPDIMGIGGHVLSAAYAEYGGSATMSGTSMSSPYIAGCTAVLREYLKKQGVSLSDTEFTARVRQLLMNTAYPYEDENGLFITPRRQGAGMAALDRACNAKVLMTGDAGDAKINLFDMLGDSFSFNVTFTNYSDEDVTFPQAEIRLTTDGTYFNKNERRICLRGQQELNCTADLCGPVTIAAGDTLTVPVTVTLDAARCRELEQTFHYGFFAEGYLLLSGAENSADISIPMLGYHGDWTQIPIVSPGTGSIQISLGFDEDHEPVSLIRKGQIMRDILSRVSESRIRDSNDPFDLILYQATEAESQELQFISDECWISPNNDTLADRVYGYLGDASKQRIYTRLSTELINADGDTVFFNPDGGFFDDNELYMFTDLDEGDYSCILRYSINYQDSAERPQIIYATIHIDKTKPEVTSETIEEDGRTYLVIRASDDRKLQGIAVIGSGSGGEAGVYQPDGNHDALRMHTLAQLLYSNPYNSGESLDSSAAAYGYDVAGLPFVLRGLIGFTELSECDDIDFVDILAPEPDASGVWEVKYDITDLKDYSFTVMDEAYNYVEICTTGAAAESLAERKGTWIDLSGGFYVFSGDKVTFTSYLDGSVTEYRYTADKEKLTLVSGSERKTLTVKRLTAESFRLTDPETGHASVIRNAEEGKGEYIVRDDGSNEISEGKYVRYISKSFHPLNEVLEILKEDFRTQCEYEPEVEYYLMHSPSDVEISLVYSEKPDFWIENTINISLTTGLGHSDIYEYRRINGKIEGNTTSKHLDLFPEYITELQPGIYSAPFVGDTLLVFNDDGETGTIMYSRSLWGMGFGFDGDAEFTYTLDENGYLSLNSDAVKLLGWVTWLPTEEEFLITFDTEHEHWGRTHGGMEMKLVTDDPEKIAALPSTEEICELGAAYIDARTGFNVPANGSVCFCEPFNILYSNAVEGDYYHSFSLMIDIETMDFTDNDGNTGNLLNLPKMPDNAAYTLKELGKMALKKYKDKTGARVENVIPYLLSDGRVLVILENEYYMTLEKYYADPVTGEIQPMLEHRGDVNCDGTVDVADAVLLARFFAEDRTVSISSEGMKNADCNLDTHLSYDDLTAILRAIARLLLF